MKFLLAVLEGVWKFGLLLDIYVLAVVLDPVTTASQAKPLSVYIPIPTDLVGIISAVGSFWAFVLYRYLGSRPDWK